MPPIERATAPTSRTPIWDAPVRLFHWLLVGLLAFSWWSGKHHDMDWHRRSGYMILALLILRIYWGFFGGRTARFTQFVRGPRSAFAYARALAKGRHIATPGHNPIGGWSVIVMLGSLAVMVCAGLFSVDIDGLESGPLADYVSFDHGRGAAAIHHLMFNLLLGLAALHVLAVLFYLVRLRRDLITPMIHGRGRVHQGEAVEDLASSGWKAVLGIVIAGVCTYAISRGLHF